MTEHANAPGSGAIGGSAEPRRVDAGRGVSWWTEADIGVRTSQELIDGLRKKASPRIHLENLPFPYVPDEAR